jgi:signal transduction histidine kinase
MRPTSASRRLVWMIVVAVCVLGVYAGVSLWLTHTGNREALTAFGNLVQCLVPLVANAGLLANAGTPHWRRNLFWMLLAMSCTLWMIGQFEWTYYEVYKHAVMPNPYPGDMVFFLRGIPLIAALALRPHRTRAEARMRFGYLDFVLLITWWTYLYAFTVLPWVYAAPSADEYNFTYNVLTSVGNIVVAAGFGAALWRSRGAWKAVYANLLGATLTYSLTSITVNVLTSSNSYSTGSLWDLGLIASFLWYAIAGVIAYQNQARLEAPSDLTFEEDDSSRGEAVWATRLAMAAVLSLPLFAIYTLRFGHDAPAVRDFRLMTTLIASVPLALLVFLRSHLADADRTRLLVQSEQSVQNLQRLQAQMVQSEKLVSLGQLAAGAAHEINNPLAAILGYSDLLADDEALPEKARSTAAKIRDQARRTKTLVGNLLSFARQVPPERTLLDINTVVTNAMQLRALDLRSGTTRVEQQLESVLPGVRGDGNQLMQVFFNIISNAVDAMESTHGSGVLTIKTLRDRGNVVVLFLDTGPGIKEPHRVFDPFYTTKPVGKGTGLGLSICFGIVQEHGGRILCYNRQEGGAVFRVELPAVLAALPTRELQLSGTSQIPHKTN